MTRLREWIARLWGTLRPGRHDRDLEEELRLHVDLAVDRARRESGSIDGAARAAVMHAGGIAQAMEAMRDQRGLPWLEDIGRDLRYAGRLLRRDPGFTVVAVLTLAIGIGVNTTVFTAYKAMVARPLDARDPGSLVNLALTSRSGGASFAFSYPDYEAYRDSVRAFSDVIAFVPDRLTLSNVGGIVSQRDAAAGTSFRRLGLLSPGASNAEFASTFVVSENYFKVLGVSAVRGRTFDAVDRRELVASPSVLISENYWRRRFAADPAVLGKTVHLNGAPVTVIGITPHDFVGTSVAVPDFWLPIGLAPLVHADATWLRNRENERCRLFARLAPGVTIAQAQAETNIVADRLRALHDPLSDSSKPATMILWTGSPFPLPLRLYGGLNLTILLIMVAAGMVLAVACANVGSLQLARARSRQAELHTRLSLGASRLRVIRQLLTESALLGLLAGSAALLFTWAILRVSATLIADAMPAEYGTLAFNVTPDLAIFAYVCAISVMAGILFGLTPALESSRAALVSTVRTGTSSTRSRRIQDVLVMAQVALSLVLLIAGSMLIRSAIRSITMDTGYEHTHVIDVTFSFPEASTYTADRKDAVVRQLRTRVAALPGVTAIASARPPGGNVFQTPVVALAGQTSAAPGGQSLLFYTYVEASFFQTVSIPLSLGHGFQSKTGDVTRSVVVSESAARQLWPGQNPVGRSLRLGPTDERPHNLIERVADGPAYQVIGVARDTRGARFDRSDAKMVYLLLPEDRVRTHPLLVRTASDPADVIRALDSTISAVDPDLLATSSTLEELLRQSTPFIISSLLAAVASTIGLIGLLLAAMGIYGTVSYIVARRTREVGIRMAVGAQNRDILGLIMRESTRPVLAGLLVGVGVSAGGSYLLRGVFYGLNTIDGLSIIGVSFVFLIVALLAAYPPSRRALRVDPVVALRYE
jgi:putative ABC transport system permease protein